MKKFLLLASACLYGMVGFAQRKNLIKLDIHSPIFRTGIISYERVLNTNSSIGIGFLYTDQSGGFTNATYLSRLAITPEYRFFLSKKEAPSGFYASAFARYQWMEAREWNTLYDDFGMAEPYNYYIEKELSTFGGGLTLGFQEVFKERIVIDLFLGTVWNSGDKRKDLSAQNNYYTPEPNEIFKPYVGYFIRSGVNVGIAF
ncbi:MAG: DUF3575 domain-containing protein [Crocinitomicaceae bacterium]|nr:DUF3575 domain-containing protein [Crocinitomicaceae bacterium]